MSPSLPWNQRRRQGHMVVCGGDGLTARLLEELSTRYDEEVVVLNQVRDGERAVPIESLGWAKGRLITVPRLDGRAFQFAELESARALALMNRDDIGNIHAALRAYEINSDLRLVVRMYNATLGLRLHQMFADCTVLSDAEIAAPAFVAAAMGRVAPSLVRLSDRTLFVAPRGEVEPKDVLCALADTRDGEVRVLPDANGAHEAELVLASATGPTRNPLRRGQRRRQFTTWLETLSSVLNRKLSLALLAPLLVLGVGTFLFHQDSDIGWFTAAYLTLLTAAGAGNPDSDLSGAVQATQLMVTIAGLTLIPLTTATIVEAVVTARLARTLGRLRRPVADHIVVVGLGDVGARVISQLHDLGYRVVGVESREDARGIMVARQLGIPVLIGDGSDEETLKSACIEQAIGLAALADDDMTNLEAGLAARGAAPDLRVVLRLFDGDLAARVQRQFDIPVSRSVSYLAAPAFAAAMVERKVIGTIPIGRRVLLVADVPVEADSALVGEAVRAVDIVGQSRVVALLGAESSHPTWAPEPGRTLRGGDRMIVLATRAGLGRILSRSTPQPPV